MVDETEGAEERPTTPIEIAEVIRQERQAEAEFQDERDEEVADRESEGWFRVLWAEKREVLFWVFGVMVLMVLFLGMIIRQEVAVQNIQSTADKRTQEIEELQRISKDTKETVDKIRDISEDTNELTTFVAEAQSPEGQAEQDARLQALVQGVRAEINCDNREALTEALEPFVDAGLVEPVTIRCPGD